MQDAFALDDQNQRQLQAFLKKNQLEPIALAQVIHDLRDWLVPLLLTATH